MMERKITATYEFLTLKEIAGSDRSNQEEFLRKEETVIQQPLFVSTIITLID
jgi:hypothetical protein